MAVRFSYFITLIRLCCFLLSVQSCSTLTGRTQIVPVDSVPRGLKVYRSATSTVPIGQTPFLLSGPRDRDKIIYFSSNFDPTRHKNEFRCDLRWQTTFLGNGLLSAVFLSASVPAALVVGAGSVGLDLLSGAGYACNETLILKEPAPSQTSLNLRTSKTHLESTNKICHRYLVFPPTHGSELASDTIADLWIAATKEKNKSCDVFLAPRKVRSILSYYNIDSERDLQFSELARDQLLQMAYETKATDLVFLQYKLTAQAGKEQIVFFPKSYDVFNGRNSTNSEITAVVAAGPKSAEALEEIRHPSWFSYSFKLFPNSLRYQLIDSKPLNNAQVDSGDITIKESTDRDRLPTYLSSWSLTTIDHPKGFGVWDIQFSAYPSYATGYWNQHYILQSSKAGPNSETFPYDLELFYVTVLYNAAMTLHTPAGAFSLALGYGPSVGYMKDSEGTRDFETIALADLEISYSAFLTNNLHAFISIDAFTPAFPTKTRLQSNYFRFNGWASTAIGLGYYLPELKEYWQKGVESLRK